MSIPQATYTTTLQRTLQSIQHCAALPPSKPAKERLGVQHHPIIRISPEHVVLNELHLLLRIGDVLIRNLIFEMVLTDRRSQRNRTYTPATSHLKLLEAKICSECKVTFRIWEKRDVSGKPSGNFEWTSVMGTDMKKIITLLPSTFSDLLRTEISQTMFQIWKASIQS